VTHIHSKVITNFTYVLLCGSEFQGLILNNAYIMGGGFEFQLEGFQFSNFQILDQPLAYPIQFCGLWLVELINQQGDTLNVCIYDF
jgi:hypothetical protein